MTDFPWLEDDGASVQEMSSMDYWRLCDELTILQAALLLIGCDPGGADSRVEHWSVSSRPRGYEAAKTAIMYALKQGQVEGTTYPEKYYSENGTQNGESETSICVHESHVNVASLKRWLASRGFASGFFFPNGAEEPDFLDENHPRYAPKLAAAVRAWQAMDNESLMNGKSPKAALQKWLREHAADFGLTDQDGKQNQQGIDEIAKVANWDTTGGAPKTRR